MQGIVMKDDDPDDLFLIKVPYLFYDGFDIHNLPVPPDWESFQLLFAAELYQFRLSSLDSTPGQ
jgi:hypothetical protein